MQSSPNLVIPFLYLKILLWKCYDKTDDQQKDRLVTQSSSNIAWRVQRVSCERPALIQRARKFPNKINLPSSSPPWRLLLFFLFFTLYLTFTEGGGPELLSYGTFYFYKHFDCFSVNFFSGPQACVMEISVKNTPQWWSLFLFVRLLFLLLVNTVF